MDLTASDSERAIAVGMTRSGKTYTLRRIFIDRYPRVLVNDRIGEWKDWKGAHHAVGLDETLALLEAAAKRRTWRIVTSGLEEEELASLARLLVPPGGPYTGYAYAVGGMALALDEADETARQGAAREVLAMWNRGRHAGLSIFAATQRPSGVARIVTAMSRWVIVCQLGEPADLRYLQATLSADAYAAAESLPWHYTIMWDRQNRLGYLLNESRRIVRRFGNIAPARAGARPVAPGNVRS